MAAQRPSSFACLTRSVRGGNHGCEGDLWDGPPPLSGTGRLPVLIPRTRRSGTMRIVVLGIDLGKNVCSLAGLDETGAVVLRRRMKRASVLPFTAQLETCTVAMEACCGAHHLGRQLVAQGHVVRLMSPAYVQPYVKAQKNDERDAEAIAEAATRPTMRYVEIKSEAQLEVQSLHRVRGRLVAERTALINQLRALMLERGIAVPQGRCKLARRRSISLPSPPNDVGFNLTVGPDAAPRAINPKTGKRKHVSAI